MKKLLALFLVLVMAAAIMVVPAAAATGETGVEPCVEIGVECIKCGGPSVYAYSEVNTYKWYYGDCGNVPYAHYHQFVDYDDLYTCRNCGTTFCVTTRTDEICQG